MIIIKLSFKLRSTFAKIKKYIGLTSNVLTYKKYNIFERIRNFKKIWDYLKPLHFIKFDLSYKVGNYVGKAVPEDEYYDDDF